MKRCGNAIVTLVFALVAVCAQMAVAQETVIYGFSGSPDGSALYGGLIMDAAGNLYGTTSGGGAVDAPYDTSGTVFELMPTAGGGWTEKVLYSFGASGDGANPYCNLIFDAQGNLYGTTTGGGAHSDGTVFELTPGSGGTWTEKLLYSFGVTSADGATPSRSGLVFDAHGNLFGTTRYGGGNSVNNGGGLSTAGTVFELIPGSGGTWTEKVLYSFGANSTDGANPIGGVVLDATGNVYGTTLYGGASNSGTVFELASGSGGTWTESILHSFDPNGTDGSLPAAGLVADAQGNLYGTTYGGGSNPFYGGFGVVFEMSPTGGGNWSEQIIHSFAASITDGDYPYGKLIFDAAGNLYGTTSSRLYGYGEVFKLSPAAGGWTEDVLYFFNPNPDGQSPQGSVFISPAGNLYGTTSTGGPNDAGLGGIVFEISSVTTAAPVFSPAPGVFTKAQTVTITDATAGATIYYTTDDSTPTTASTQYTAPITVSDSETIKAFAVATGVPQSQVAIASYQIGETTAQPQFSPAAGFYTEAQSVTLTDADSAATIYYTTNGAMPTPSSTKYTGAIAVASTETIQAIAVASGYGNSPVASATYTITQLGAPQEKVLYSFGLTGTDGGVPHAGLVSDSKGNLYGTTEYGGPNMVKQGNSTVTAGTVFELSPGSGGIWTEKVLYNFGANSNDGANPLAGVVIDAQGNLYGTTLDGGSVDDGTVFELSPSSSGLWTEKILHNFFYLTSDGTAPHAGVIIDSAGNLYGTTYGGGANSGGSAAPGGTVFELSPASGGTWTYQLLHSFSYLSKTDGYYPDGALIFDSKGNLYGTTSDGGSAQDEQGGGTVFELTPIGGGGWTEKVLYSFGGGNTSTGYMPMGSLAIDSAGNLYGTNNSGGQNGFGLDGTIFELSPTSSASWTEKTIYSLGGNETDGINSQSGLLIDAQDNLYGTSTAGGAYGYGSVFELSTTTGAEQVLHSFDLNGTDGASSYSTLLFDASGNLYGTTAFGGKYGPSNSGLVGGTVFEIVSATTTQEPTFSPGTGTYASAQSVTITDATPDATIYYTTNGTAPTTSSTKYTGAITVSATETIKAIGVASGYANSAVASATYTIATATAATPTFSPIAGTYASAQSVTIADSTSGATIYYTTNGTAPTTASTKYTTAISVSATETIEAIAVATGYANSAVASATYTITSSTTGALQFIPVTPCRIADTRNASGAFGGPELAGGATRTFNVPQSACNIPSTAVAYSLNVTVVPIQSLGYLSIWPAGEAQPVVSTLNSDGRVKANATITPAGTSGGVSVYASDATQFILDIDGYFVPAGTSTSGLEFFPLTPCRIADTRNATGALGGPSLTGGVGRAFPVQSSSCGIPSTAKAYSLNITAVPHGRLGYLTTWPTGQAQPVVSTLNSSTGEVTANAAIVPAGAGGDISIFVSDTADVILDVNGYFAPPGSGGLSLYTVTPCRAIDTRNGAGAFDGVLTVPVHTGTCAPPATAQAYVLNATVVPTASLSYLTLWAAGGAQPGVSTLNATDGAVTSNMAIVPTSNGGVDAFSTDATQLLLDISSYFAP
jgi:uncharacterized repeat protein (TIGR03803 family)